MTDVRQILLDAMMSDRAPAAPGSNQAKVDELAREINGRIVDHFLAILERKNLYIVGGVPMVPRPEPPTDCNVPTEPCRDIACTGDCETNRAYINGMCRNPDHYELRA